ncbi:hypothetical protein B0O99DRAFT_512639 [Bisporella sp. PMI_857]|nr:hypothetical protein B0O99DRAFT_512639 [Bisporella sp. PMI_857]
MLLKSFFTLTTVLASIVARPSPGPDHTTGISKRGNPGANHTIVPSALFEFPNPTWLENFAVRPNGQLVITLITSPEIYLFDPITSGPPVKLFTIPQYLALLGIVEYTPDIYYFVAGNFTSPNTPESSGIGSYSIFKIDLRTDSMPHAPTKIIDIPESAFLNGLEVLSVEDGLLIVADSGLGLVWKVDIFKRSYEVFIDVPEMKIGPNAKIQLGINGIHIKNEFLYFTSMAQELFCRAQLTRDDSQYIIGEIETIATGIFGDDFTLDRFGNAWITQDPMDQLTLVIGDGVRKGEVITVAGAQNIETVAGGTRSGFGRTEQDKDILYVVTNGGIAAPVNGVVEGGKVLAFNTYGYLAGILG